MFSRVFFLFSLFLSINSAAVANPIFYELDNVSGSTWEYSYTVDNQSASPIDEFTIYFDLSLYENLVISGSPSLDWDGLAIQPDPLLPDDGFADWLALGLPIASGETLGGFSVVFDYLGTGTPGSQFFEIIDSVTFNVVSNGFTQPLLVAVSEPSILVLFGLGFAVLLVSRRSRIS